MQAVETVLMNGRIGGNVHRLDRLAHGSLHAAQETPFPRREKQDGVAAAAGPAGATNAVDIGLTVKGNVVIGAS